MKEYQFVFTFCHLTALVNRRKFSEFRTYIILRFPLVIGLPITLLTNAFTPCQKAQEILNREPTVEIRGT